MQGDFGNPCLPLHSVFILGERKVKEVIMREIKFRVWHKQLKQMYGDAWHGRCVGEASTNSTNDHLRFLQSHDMVLMQYTGLKDKNGREIYEGDIVNVHIFVQELGENFGVVEGEREFVAEVEFGVTGISVKNKNFSDNPVFYDQFHEESLEVTGNIYENPELLK